MFNRNKNVKNGQQDGTLYKTINTVSIVGAMLAVAIFVFMLMGYLPRNATVFGFVVTVLIVCVVLIISQYWVKRFEQNEYKKTALVFLILHAVLALLWIICLWLAIGVYKKLVSSTDVSTDSYVVLINFIKYTLMFSLQFVVASFIGRCVTRYGKNMLPFQIMSYVSYAYADFYISFAMICMNITKKGLSIASGISILGNKLLITFLIISLLYIAIASGVVRGSEKRRMRQMVDDSYKQPAADSAPRKEEISPDEKLEKLKALLDKNLITEEEYNKKREEVMKDL